MKSCPECDEAGIEREHQGELKSKDFVNWYCEKHFKEDKFLKETPKVKTGEFGFGEM